MAALGLVFTLSACGTEDATNPGSGAPDGTTTSEPQLTSEDTDADSETGTDDREAADGELGRLLVNQRLAIDAPEYPLPGVPMQVSADTPAELGEAYAVVPGIDEIVAELEAQDLAAGERLFAYTVNACITDDVALEMDGDDVRMVVRGTSTIRCAPPTTLVVWAVGDAVPAGAEPVQAVQK